jgi:hypothetical protein
MIIHPSSVIELSWCNRGDQQVLKSWSKQSFTVFPPVPIIPLSGSSGFCLDGPLKETNGLHTRCSKKQS